jgi:hypothetical protein
VVGDLGGRVDTASAPGEGMRMAFRIPCLPARAEPSGRPGAGEPGGGQQGPGSAAVAR